MDYQNVPDQDRIPDPEGYEYMSEPVKKTLLPRFHNEDVAKHLARQLGIPVNVALRWVDLVVLALGDFLLEADPERDLVLRNFGRFRVSLRVTAAGKRHQSVRYVTRDVNFRAAQRIRTLLGEDVTKLGYDVTVEDVRNRKRVRGGWESNIRHYKEIKHRDETLEEAREFQAETGTLAERKKKLAEQKKRKKK